MPRYLKTNATAKSGINFIRTLVESHNCIFQKIDQENDVGIDALIELVQNEKPTGNFIATQIKSGSSYFDKKENLCKIPIGNHREYWARYSLPVYGIVYIPEFDSAYWIDIKKYLKNNPLATLILYEPTLANILNKKTFLTQFVPHLTDKIPEISFEFAKDLFGSQNPDEFYLGLYTLFKKYAYKNEVWQLFVDYFKSKPIDEIPEQLVYYLSVIPWHPDLYFFQDSHTKESRDYGKTLLNRLNQDDVIKLLHFVDEENMISRGSLGQSVEAIVSAIENFVTYLENIIKDKTQAKHIREVAALIYAFHIGKESIPILSSMLSSESWYIQELIHHISVYGEFNPYS
jgi:hypothetical protein